MGLKHNKILGAFGEECAAAYLQRKGYKIIHRNYTVDLGEIDIIAAYKDMLVFLEVKTRKSTMYGHPSQAVNHYKQLKIIQVAQCYLQQTCQYNKICRFDVMEVFYRSKEDFQVNHIENAFEL